LGRPADVGERIARRERHQLDPVALGIDQLEVARLVAVVRDAEPVEVRSRIVDRAVLAQLEARVLVARLAARRPQLERVRLVAAGEVRTVDGAQLTPLGESELDAPAPSGLVEVGHAQADVVDAPQRDHGSSRPSRTRSSASDSGIASATCSVLAETWICSPGPLRSTSQSTTVLVRRGRPPISTSTVSPGCIGRLFAGVPVSTTSPGSSVIRRERSASW